MRVIITGGAGLIGRALAAELAGSGHEVVLLSRSPARATGLPPGVSVAGWDARSASGWAHIAEGAGAIVNLAGESIGESRWTLEQKRRLRESRLLAGQAVSEAVRLARVKPEAVVQASGAGIYGPRGDEELGEDARPGDDFLSKLAVEWEASTASVTALGVRHVVIRNAVVLSLQGGAFPRLLLPFRFFAGGRLGNGRQWFPWIHIEDEARAIRFLCEDRSTSGPYNLASPNPLTNARLARAVGRALRRPSFVPVPAPALKLAFGEMSTVLLDGQRALPRRLTAAGFRFRFPEIDGALSDLLKRQGKG